MNPSEHPRVYEDLGAFEVGFLDPLAKRGFQRTTVPLSDMRGWQVDLDAKPLSAEALEDLRTAVFAGADDHELQTLFARLAAAHTRVVRLKGRYEIAGWRCQPDNSGEYDPILPHDGWDQPGLIQAPGVVAQIFDLEGYALVRGIWEPGHVGRGWRNSSLLVDVSTKYSPGHKAMWAAKGTTPPLADLVETLRCDHRSVLGAIERAPYDGARDEKVNLHLVLRTSRETICDTVQRFLPRAQQRYALVSRRLLDELNTLGLVPLHLRDLLSLASRG